MHMLKCYSLSYFCLQCLQQLICSTPVLQGIGNQSSEVADEAGKQKAEKTKMIKTPYCTSPIS